MLIDRSWFNPSPVRQIISTLSESITDLTALVVEKKQANAPVPEALPAAVEGVCKAADVLVQVAYQTLNPPQENLAMLFKITRTHRLPKTWPERSTATIPTYKQRCLRQQTKWQAQPLDFVAPFKRLPELVATALAVGKIFPILVA